MLVNKNVKTKLLIKENDKLQSPISGTVVDS
jgi:hypothetical protein